MLAESDNSTIPDPWPEFVESDYNITNPLSINMGDNNTADTFIAVSAGY